MEVVDREDLPSAAAVGELSVLVRELCVAVHKEHFELRRSMEDFATVQRKLTKQVERVAQRCSDDLEEEDEREDERKGESVSQELRERDSASAWRDGAEEGGAEPAGPEREGSEAKASPPEVTTTWSRRQATFSSNQAEERKQNHASQHWAFVIVQNEWFSYAVGLIILANSLMIGLEIDMDIRGEVPQAIQQAEHVFLVIYILELGLRFRGMGLQCLRNPWVIFDLVLVLTGIITTWIVIPIVNRTAAGGTSGRSTFAAILQQVLIFRTLRLLRLVRALRLVAFFKPLWNLVRGILNSLSTMLSAFLLLLLTIYIFACIGGEIITKTLKDDEQVGDHVLMHFGTVPAVMLTLVQFVTGDSIASIYGPLVYRKPWLAMYFVVLILLVSVTLMNLVTAIIVEDSIARARSDMEMETHYARLTMKKLAPAVRQVFRDLDVSDNGTISIQEIVDGIGRLSVQLPPELRDLVKPDKLVDLFEFLDLDGSGELEETEFVEGVSHLALMNVSIETTQTLQLLRHMRGQIGHLKARLDQIDGAVHQRFDMQDTLLRPRRKPTKGVKSVTHASL